MTARQLSFVVRRLVLIVAASALAVCAAITPTPSPREALATLIAAEQAFAARSVADGMRAAFLANFADDGLMFSPQPVNAKRVLAAQPPEGATRAVRLEWSPAAAAVTASEDVGFTTGPFALVDTRSGKAAEHGVFFSIWRREAGARWQVVIDAGVTTPTAVSKSALAPAPALDLTIAPSEGRVFAGREPADFESRARAVALAGGAGGGYADWFAADGRLQQNGFAPVIGREQIHAHLLRPGTAPAKATFSPEGSGIANDRRLAWTYGRLTLAERADAPPGLDEGWYVHLWARDPEGRWRLIVATVLETRERR